MSNPFRAGYWFGVVSPEPQALFRIALGLSLLHDALSLAPNLRAFFSDDGILPRAELRDPFQLSVFHWVGSPAAVAALFGLGICAVLAFTLGYRTRLAAALSFVFVVSLRNRNLYIDDGGDDLVRNLLFLSVFADLGGCYSLDVRRGRRARGDVSALGLRFLQLHVAILYFCAARLKLRAGWLKKDTLYRCLQLFGFVRPPGALLGRFPLLCYGLGVATVALEGAFAFFALSPMFVRVCRALAIAANIAIQIGILATMRVGIFTEAMLATSFLFVPAEWVRAGAAFIGRGSSTAHASPARPPLGPVTSWLALRRRPALFTAFFLLSFNLVTMAWGPFAGRRFPLPAALTAPRRWLTLDQPFGLFDVSYAGPEWSALGTLSDGRQVDVLSVVVPALSPRVAWTFSRWYKFTFVVQDHSFPYPRLADYLCAEYQRRTTSSLQSIALRQTLVLPHSPNARASFSETRVLVQQRCRPQPPRASRYEHDDGSVVLQPNLPERAGERALGSLAK